MDAFEAEVSQVDLNLARACLLLARDAHRGLDVDAYLARFQPWAARVGERARSAGFVRAVLETLAREEGFRGVQEDYYDPENSLLDTVLDRRRGLPIMLSIVYLEVARRLGEPLVAVGLPGHFLVRYEETLLDPFHGGVPVTREDCQRILDRVSGGRLRLSDGMLAPVGDRDVLTRVLTNLKNAYVRRHDLRRAIRVSDRMLQLNPIAFPALRDRGLLKQATGDVEGARADLSRYVDAMPRAPDADAVRRLLGRG